MNFVLFHRHILVVLICAIPSFVWADDEHDAILLDQLLKLRSPAPDWRVQLQLPDPARDAAPAADADLETLAEFWRYAPQKTPPEPAVLQRLLKWCESHPDDLDDLLRWFPTDAPEFHDRLKSIADRLSTSPTTEPARPDTVVRLRDWLMTHSRYYRDDLIALTRQAFAGDDTNRLARMMETLARLDRPAALKLLHDLASAKNVGPRTAALVWLHHLNNGQGGEKDTRKWRTVLQQTVASRTAPPHARDYALWGLMWSRWPGQEDWFLGLFRDASLTELREDSTLYHPLCTGVSSDPDRWIPLVATLIGGPNRTAHNNAARCLASFNLERARADALRPLLPWLSNPKWAADSETDLPRLRLIQSLERIDLPESVPGLIRVLQHEKEYYASGAAEALLHYRAPGTEAALKEAIPRETDEYHRRPLIAAALAANAYSVEELAQSVLAYIAQLSTEEGREALERSSAGFEKKPLDPRVSIGAHLSRWPVRNDELVALLLREASTLAATQPDSARQLREMLAGWPGNVATQDIVQRLQTGDLTAEWIAQALERRHELAEGVSRIEGLRGIRRGVQAAIVGAENEFESILRGEDRAAKLALLACARRVRATLPLTAVEPLLRSTDEAVASAAEAFLVGEDSPAARTAVLGRHAGEASILGLRMNYDPGHETFGPMTDSEERLRELVRAAEGPREIFALLSEGYWGNIGQRMVLVYDDKTVLRWHDGGGRRRERQVTPEESARLRAWLATHRVDDLAPFDQHAYDGIQYEYVHVTRDGGRRVFMNNPPGNSGFAAVFPGGHANEPNPAIYGRLCGQFVAISSPPMEVSYDTLRELPGFRLLHVREQGHALALAFDRGKLVVQLRDNQAGLTWHPLEAAGLQASEVKAPDLFRTDAGLGHREADFPRMLSRDVVQRGTGPLAGKYLWTGSRKKDGVEGLWLSDEKTEPKLIVRGTFGQPILTPDGQWVVAAKAGGLNWAVPNGVVRIHISDGRAYQIALPPADYFNAIAWLPAHQKVLLHRAKDATGPGGEPPTGPDEPEFHLLDPASGALTKVTGEFQPLLLASSSPLQPATDPDETWAALPSSEIGTPATIVGRYDTRDFKFLPALTIFGLTFSSTDMWVDEAAHHVTFVVNGDVLRLALP